MSGSSLPHGLVQVAGQFVPSSRDDGSHVDAASDSSPKPSEPSLSSAASGSSLPHGLVQVAAQVPLGSRGDGNDDYDNAAPSTSDVRASLAGGATGRGQDREFRKTVADGKKVVLDSLMVPLGSKPNSHVTAPEGATARDSSHHK